jgi:hypothetical protein
LSVHFADLSVRDPISWSWDFGDGGTSAEQRPWRVYETLGRYTVSLTVSNWFASDSDVKERYIRVTFPDVPSDHWACDQVLSCVEAGIVAGYDDGLYRPDTEVTRDQMAVYIARALAGGEENVPAGPAEATFEDVPNTGYGESETDPYWAYDHVEYCYAENVVQGYTWTTYEPAGQVTRDLMAVYVARAMVAPGGDVAIPHPPPTASFADVPTTFWAYKQVEYCVGQGVVKGYDDGLYHPDWVVTRDQMAVYIAKAFGLP